MYRTLITAISCAAVAVGLLVFPALADDDRHYYHHRHHAGPPDWAPAHGYRRHFKHRHKHHHHHYDHYPVYDYPLPYPYPEPYPRLSRPLPGIKLGHCNRDALGTMLGAATGGLLGAQIGDGRGQLAAVGAGVFLGALIGGGIGRHMDQIDQNCVGQMLDHAPNNRPIAWQNPYGDVRYTATATTSYVAPDGRYCREYQTTATVGGRVQDMYGTACRQPDGSWQLVR